MQWIRHKYYTHQYYKITKDGEQVSLYDKREEDYIVHIHHDCHMTQYHFIPPGGDYEMNVPYTVDGLSVRIRNQTYELPPASFIVQGNRLFDRSLLRWLCVYYLGIMPADTCTVSCRIKQDELSGTQLHVKTSLQKDIM